MWHIYAMGYYLAIRKDEIPPFATTWMDLENIVLSEENQSEKAKKHTFHSYVAYKTETHRHRQKCGGDQRERQ